jgi:hypothetical protein
VVSLLPRGLSNRQLAAALHVSENTFESHPAHVYDKLGVRSRSQLLALFFAETYRPALMHRNWLSIPGKQASAEASGRARFQLPRG